MIVLNYRELIAHYQSQLCSHVTTDILTTKDDHTFTSLPPKMVIPLPAFPSNSPKLMAYSPTSKDKQEFDIAKLALERKLLLQLKNKLR